MKNRQQNTKKKPNTGKFPEKYISQNTETSKQEQTVLHPYLIFPLSLRCHKKNISHFFIQSHLHHWMKQKNRNGHIHDAGIWQTFRRDVKLQPFFLSLMVAALLTYIVTL